MLTKGLFGAGVIGAMSQIRLETLNIANTASGTYPMSTVTELGSKPGITFANNIYVGTNKVFTLTNLGTYKLRVYSGNATLDTGTEERSAEFDFLKYTDYFVSATTQNIYVDSTYFDSAGPIPLTNFNINFYHSNASLRYTFAITKGVTTASFTSSPGWFLQLDYLSPDDIT